MPKRFLNADYVFSKLSPLENDVVLYLNKLIPLNPNTFCAKFASNWPSGSGEEDENVKSLPQQQLKQTTDKFQYKYLTYGEFSFIHLTISEVFYNRSTIIRLLNDMSRIACQINMSRNQSKMLLFQRNLPHCTSL